MERKMDGSSGLRSSLRREWCKAGGGAAGRSAGVGNENELGRNVVLESFGVLSILGSREEWEFPVLTFRGGTSGEDGDSMTGKSKLFRSLLKPDCSSSLPS
jgi:hypothetical protein